MRTLVVAKDGSGDFRTVQAAVDVASNDKGQRTIIRIKPGTYKEKLVVPKGKGPIAFIGEDALATVLTCDDYAGKVGADGKELGTGGSYSTKIDADDFSAENITFENSHPTGGGTGNQALALSMSGDRGVFRKCRFLGRQDTLYLHSNRQYFEECYIAGQVDFIFGGATAFFERCELHCVAPGVAITAASTPQGQAHGFVFSRCRITAAPGATWKTHLGRPWRPYASVAFLKTEMADVIAPAGWDNWGKGENEKTARFAEYQNAGPGAQPAARVAWSRQLPEDEGVVLFPREVFGGWNPNPVTPERIAALPEALRRAWEAYYARSVSLHENDVAILAAEMKARGLDTAEGAPRGKDFKLGARNALWFAGDEAKRLADVILSFQLPSGGWSKAVGYDAPRRPGMAWTSQTDIWHYAGTFDNRATLDHLRFLAGVYGATQRQDARAAFERGLDYILSAQMPHGGWPQVFPLEGGYHDNVTINDNALGHILNLLQDVAEAKSEFAFVDAARRRKAQEAVARGVEGVLAAQIAQNGRKTAWCAQHDPITLAAAPARRMEPASISGGESVGITRFLMRLPNPSPRVVRAVEDALSWFERSELTQGNAAYLQQTGGPVWARFYDIETNEPIFVDLSKGVTSFKGNTGYDYILPAPRDLLQKDAPKWRERLAKSKTP